MTSSVYPFSLISYMKKTKTADEGVTMHPIGNNQLLYGRSRDRGVLHQAQRKIWVSYIRAFYGKTTLAMFLRPVAIEGGLCFE